MTTNKRRKITSSYAIEYKSLGAPAKDYIPAPVDEAIIANVTSQDHGQETSAAITAFSSYKVYLSPTIPSKIGKDKYMKLVNSWAAIDPLGIFILGFSKSPDLLAPAMIPVTEGKYIDM